MKRSLILMTILVISSLMIAPALAQTLIQTQDQQTETTSPVYVAAADETPSTVVATKEAVSSKVFVGNTDTKSYYLYGMDGYNRSKRITGSILALKSRPSLTGIIRRKPVRR